MTMFLFFCILFLSCLGLFSNKPVGISALSPTDDVMMQAFYWDVPVDEPSLNGTWWDNLSDKADELKAAGISAIWTPCPSKGNWGISDNGYGIYDHYDLGNYLQKGSVETRFGSRSELENMLRVMHSEPRINVYSDVVLNHIYSDEENEETNPIVKEYVFSEAAAGQYIPYPSANIKWVIPDAPVGDYHIHVKGYCLPWSGPASERAYEVSLRWGDDCLESSTLRGHIDSPEDIDEYKITLEASHDIEIRLYPKHKVAGQWEDASIMYGYYPVAVWHDGVNLANTVLEARTNTRMVYPRHTGHGEKNYEWRHIHFHPAHSADWLGDFGTDEIMTNTIFFGNDFNTFDPEVQTRLCDWGAWLINDVGFDGFRLDFVRGFQEEFVAKWVSSLPRTDGCQPFVVGEYWGEDYRISNWVNAVGAMGAEVKGFDFPLKDTLTEMCNKSGDQFDMSCLWHAGLIRNSNGNSLPATSVVTFLDNHDTGKEHDKWVVKDYALGYAYLLTHEGCPCIFYPHFFGDTQMDANDKSCSVTAPPSLKDTLKELIAIRKRYLGGTLTVLGEIGKPFPARNIENLYVARRQGNGIKDGAIIVMNNDDCSRMSIWVTVNADGFSDWSNRTLVNVLDTHETVAVRADGRAELSAPARGYSIWVLREDIQS